MSGLRVLLKSPGFMTLMNIATSQVEARKQSIFLNPLKSMDEVLEQEYKKGEISGISLFKEMVNIQIKSLEDEIETLLKNQENSNESDVDETNA
jgi:hypothetical protein